MLLFREVYGWLRYTISRDPICQACGLVAEDIPSTLIPYNDPTDGTRTLAIYRASVGLTPRLELRFTSLNPQIKWIADVPGSEPDGTYIQITNPKGFPGDGESWDVSDTVAHLVAIAKSKFCPLVGLNLPPIMANEITGAAIPLKTVKRIIDSVKRSVERNKHLTDKEVNVSLKEDMNKDLMDFAKSVIEYLAQGKLKWDDVQWLQDKFDKVGKDIIDANWLKRQLVDKNLLGKLPPPVAEQVESQTKTIEKIINRMTEGRTPTEALSPFVSAYSVVSAFQKGNVPLNYLAALETCDPKEEIAPWSLVGRSLIAYKIGEVQAALDDSIVAWLDDSHLLLPLYRATEPERTALEHVVRSQINTHLNKTLESKAWTKHVLENLAGLDDEMGKRRALQVEFDLWLLDALSPSVHPSKIPLSAYAFSSDRKDQETYSNMFATWLGTIKKFSTEYRQESLAALTNSLKNFYAEVISTWQHPMLTGYRPRVPSVSKILGAVKSGDKNALMVMLTEDFESELGQNVPAEIKAKLEQSPYFNSIYSEVRIQSVKL